jgi:hypothetical protein
MPPALHEALSDRRRYRRQIERLHRRHLTSGRLYTLEQGDVSLARFVLERRTVARLLARDVGRGAYRLEPARLRRIVTGTKERVVFGFRLTDLIVHGVVAQVLDEAIAPRLSESLYSYRRGVSWLDAVSRFAAYVRAHRRERPDPRARGLYVLRRDVDSYTDSIPVGPRSPLWEMLRGALGPATDADRRLVETVVRPEAFVRPGALFTLYRGVPTGQPISCVLFNLYLADLDHELAAVPGAFYARYCDDLVFAHPDAAVARAAERRIEEVLRARGIGLNSEKSLTLWLTAAGRPPAWAAARGATAAPLLGCRVSAQGTVALGGEKRRRLLVDLQHRARRAAEALGPAAPPEVAGPVVCAVVNRALEARAAFSQQRSAVVLRRAVTDREDLRQLDYAIARLVLRAVTGRDDVRAFRAFPYRRMRREWRLTSVVQARNRWGRAAP